MSVGRRARERPAGVADELGQLQPLGQHVDVAGDERPSSAGRSLMDQAGGDTLARPRGTLDPDGPRQAGEPGERATDPFHDR